MANTFNPYGLARVDKVGGKDRQFTFKFPLVCNQAGTATYNVSLGSGDPMAFVATGTGLGQVGKLALYNFTAPTQTGGSPLVPAKPNTQQVPIGQFVGVEYFDLQGHLIKSGLWIANTQVKAGTVPIVTIDCDPQSIYQVQLNNPITALLNQSVQGAAGLNANFANNTAGPNVNIKSSTFALDASSINTAPGAGTFDNLYQFKILGLADMPSTDPNNSWSDQYPNVIGVFNNHFLKAGTFSAWAS